LGFFWFRFFFFGLRFFFGGFRGRRFRRRGGRAFGRRRDRRSRGGARAARAVAVVVAGDHDHRDQQTDDHRDQAGDEPARVAVAVFGRTAAGAAVFGAHHSRRVLVHRC